MGRVFKKKVGSKREAEEEAKQEESVSKKKQKKEKEPEPEPVEEEDSDEEEDVTDEDDEEVDDEDGEESNNVMEFDFEAYPPSEDDRDGIVNMLTQTFLRTDIDLKGMADAIIEKAPHGIVLTQAYDDEETEEDYMAYGLCTTLALNEKKDDAPKFIKDIFSYMLNRAKKGAPSEIYKKIEEVQESANGETALFVNERLLHFPAAVVPQLFESIRTDLAGFDTKYKNVIYIQKLRIQDNEEGVETAGNAGSSSTPTKKKGKMGKAEKKRAAAAALANAAIEFDNQEDRVLFEIKEGKEVHFDFPVHMDVEPGSKFHSTEEDGKKWNPFRRLVIMDDKRFDAFLKRGSDGLIA
uniref:Protein BCCIP homolog n=1 Tax=Caenorhabditis tropicalis TaxID=1561998 RepID=A0A1I7TVB0_9PELO